MPTEDFIKPGFVTPQMAAALQTGFGASLAANDELMNRARDMPEEFLPVKLTAVDGSGLYSWTLQYKDTTNLRVNHPNGRTGTPTNNPAYFPSGTLSTFPVECWIKRFGWDSSKGGATYEVVSVAQQSSSPISTRVYSNANIGLGSGVYTTLTWTNEDPVTDFWDAGTPTKIIIPTDQEGFYIFGFSGLIQTSDAAGILYAALIELDDFGTPRTLAFTHFAVGIGGVNSLVGLHIASGRQLLVGQSLIVKVYNGGSAANVILGDTGNGNPAFWIARQ